MQGQELFGCQTCQVHGNGPLDKLCATLFDHHDRAFSVCVMTLFVINVTNFINNGFCRWQFIVFLYIVLGFI